MERKKEWLTDEIAHEYRLKAVALSQNGRQDVGEMRRLRMELMDRCGVTEVEAINILNGYHINDYILKYEVRSGKVVLQRDDKKRKSDQCLLEEMAEMESKLQVQLQMLKDMMDD